MYAVRVEIVKFLDDAQPGWVECILTDAPGQRWSFIEKVPVVTAEQLDRTSNYPMPGLIDCEVVFQESDAPGSGVATIDTARPFGVVSTVGVSRFVVPLDLLVKD